MKHFNLFFALLMTAFIAKAQETNVDLSLNPDYTNELYFKFATNESETFPADAWEIAFLRTDAFNFAERINTYLGIEVYEASNDPNDYDTIDPSDINNWTHLYNSDTDWDEGAFDQGSATYGWGEYNPSNHHITGAVVFVLKYADDTFKKFMIEDYFSGYTFKYATWDDASSSWVDEQTVTLSNDNNPNKMFNHYSLTNNEEVVTSPDMDDWDLVFLKYETDVQGGMMYPVLGALQHPDVMVAKNSTLEVDDIDELDFSSDINTVGYDWKELDSSYQYVITLDNYFFLKDANANIYRFYFTSFDGASTGDFSLAYEDVTQLLDVEEFDENNSLSIYPNPTTDRMVNLLYDTNQSDVNVAIYNLTGQKVMDRNLNTNGYNNTQLNLTNLSSGVYLLKFTAGNYETTKKIILK